MSSADLKCPVCNRMLNESEHAIATKQLEKGFLQKYRDQLKTSKQEQASGFVKFKQNQNKQLKAIAKKTKESSKRELAYLKKNYQTQLEQMRAFYSTQNAELQNELRKAYSSQLEEMKQNYEGLSASNQRQMETIQKYLEDKVVGELKEKVSKMEQEKLSAELQLTELVQDLDSRNSEVVALKEQLRHFDIGDSKDMKDTDQTENETSDSRIEHGELDKIVKEVAQQSGLDDLKELEDGFEENEKHSFWGSRTGKRFGLF